MEDLRLEVQRRNAAKDKAQATGSKSSSGDCLLRAGPWLLACCNQMLGWVFQAAWELHLRSTSTLIAPVSLH